MHLAVGLLHQAADVVLRHRQLGAALKQKGHLQASRKGLQMTPSTMAFSKCQNNSRPTLFLLFKPQTAGTFALYTGAPEGGALYHMKGSLCLSLQSRPLDSPYLSSA